MDFLECKMKLSKISLQMKKNNIFAIGVVANFGEQNFQYSITVDTRYNIQFTKSLAIDQTLVSA